MANLDYSTTDLPDVDKDGNPISDSNPLELEDITVRIIESTDPVLGLQAGETLDDHTDSPYNWALRALYLRDLFLEDKFDNLDTSVDDASTTERGIIEIADTTEATTLTDQGRAITPALAKAILEHENAEATTSKRGTAEFANQTEGRTGTNDDKIMTSERVLDFLRNGTGASADTTRKGTVQRALADTENTDSTLYITKALAASMIQDLAPSPPDATTTVKGILETATDTEATTATATDKIITPSNLNAFFFGE